MTDTRPQQLGRYELRSLLGEGGMGKVYRGFDSTLQRNVAIKLLPPHLVRNESRLARFIQEARTASALNHPNVITVYDIGEDQLDGNHDRVRYIAMELIDGKTLRDLIGTIDLRKTLKIAIQVAEGLAAAHAAGIIHRDLKPENIMVTSAGFAKVLDFGLAKLRTADEPADIDREAKTEARGSEPGMVLGTAGYMSPEQAQGRAVDTRSDIFSFGCVLYELASERRAFRGDSAVDTMHKIIHEDPVPLRELREDVPTELSRIVRKAMAKDPDDRYQSAKEMVIDLRDLLRELESGSTPTISGKNVTITAKKTSRQTVAVAAALTAVIAIAAVAMWKSRERTSPTINAAEMRITRITSSGKVIAAALSPDARFATYVVADQGSQSLVLKDLTSGQTLTLIPARRTSYWGMTFTPDSSAIYYGVKEREHPDGAMYRIPTIGGQPRKIVDGIDSQPTFSPDGKRMAYLRAGFPSPGESSIVIANSDGTGVRALSKVRPPEFFVPIFFAGASWSPDGKVIAASIINRDPKAASRSGREESGRARIVMVDVSNGSMRTIAEDPNWFIIAHVTWMPDQKGLAAIIRPTGARAAQIWYVPYPSGRPQPITRDLFDYRIVNVSADGKSLLTIGAESTSDTWVLEQGAAPRRVDASKSEGMYGLTSLPDGRLVTTSIETGKLDLFIMNEDGSGRTQLTRDEYSNRSPVATPDGKSIVFHSSGPRSAEICRMNVDGSGRTVLATIASRGTVIDVSPDGAYAVFEEVFIGNDSGARIGAFGSMRVPVAGGAPPTRIGSEDIGIPAFSPDGSKIAGLLRDQNDGRLYLATVPVAGGAPRKVMPWHVSAFSLARWTSDGKALVVNTVDNDRANLWLIPLDGSAPRRLTNFDERSLFTFAPRAAGGWILSRGEQSRDAMVITGFRPPE